MADAFAIAPSIQTGDRPWPKTGYAWYVVLLLNFAYIVSFIDRGIFSLVVQPIKASLHLSDTQIGLLQGTAFGLFFTLMAIPFGWLADSTNRMRLVGCGIAVWSVMTAASGLATNFPLMFLTRMGVGIGEATLSPSAPSVIADYFPPERRSLPMSLYIMAAGLGLGLSLVAGGFVAHLVGARDHVVIPILGSFEPWQIIFFAVGIPGLVVSLLFLLANEPARRDHGQTKGSMRELWQVLIARRAILLPHFAGFCAFQIYCYAFSSWLPAFYMRVHHWSIVDVGYRFGLMQLIFTTPGGLIGGALARWLWRHGRRDANLLTSAIVIGVMTIPVVTATVVPNATVSFALMVLLVMTANGPGGPSVAAIQEIVPNRLRGRVTAIYYAVMSLVGISTGPVIIGLMNDRIFHDEASVGISLAILGAATLPLASGLLVMAGRRRQAFAEAG